MGGPNALVAIAIAEPSGFHRADAKGHDRCIIRVRGFQTIEKQRIAFGMPTRVDIEVPGCQLENVGSVLVHHADARVSACKLCKGDILTIR
jgi:hypothetical protein